MPRDPSMLESHTYIGLIEVPHSKNEDLQENERHKDDDIDLRWEVWVKIIALDYHEECSLVTIQK